MNLADIKIAFEQNIVLLPLEAILPLKQVSEVTKKARSVQEDSSVHCGSRTDRTASSFTAAR